jgi:hypothetical protein
MKPDGDSLPLQIPCHSFLADPDAFLGHIDFYFLSGLAILAQPAGK